MIVLGLRRVAATAAAGVLAVGLCSCSSSSSGSQAPPSGQATSTSTSVSSTASPTAADAATVAAVKDAYTKVFAPDTPTATSVSLLQDGPAFRATLEQQGSSTFAKSASVQVSTVTLQSPNTAKVTFSILVAGKTMLGNQPGYAVRENGVWKVAGQTFCGLLTLQGSAPPACTAPAATSLPR